MSQLGLEQFGAPESEPPYSPTPGVISRPGRFSAIRIPTRRSRWTPALSGLGMGLPISGSIVEAHGGRLWAENHAQRGATFYFTVPAMNGEASLATNVDQ